MQALKSNKDMFQRLKVPLGFARYVSTSFAVVYLTMQSYGLRSFMLHTLA